MGTAFLARVDPAAEEAEPNAAKNGSVTTQYEDAGKVLTFCKTAAVKETALAAAAAMVGSTAL